MRLKRFAAQLLGKSLLLGALVTAAALSALTTMRVVLGSQEVAVPSLLDQRIPEAGALAARHRLLVRVEGKRHDPKMPVDRILAQEPAAGARLKANRSVRVWISLGPRRIGVPRLQGESLRTARLKLEQSQIPVARVVEAVDPAEAGEVLLQDPPPGDVESVGDGVLLLVSRGPLGGADYVMPDLIGRREDEARNVLRRAGLKPGDVRYRPYPGVPAGVILRHVPAPGHRVSPDTAVALEVSRAS